MPVLFHRTTEAAAEVILSAGFEDVEHHDLPLCGAWVSNYPLDSNEGAKDGALLAVDVSLSTADLFYKYEVIEAGKLYREFCIPATILNTMKRWTVADEGALEGNWFNEYPPGEPEATFRDS